MNAPTHALDPAEVEAVPVDLAVVRALRQQAAQHLVSARTIADTDPEGAFALAYDASRKAALAACAAAGVRPRGPAHHAVTFDAALRVVQSRRARVDVTRIQAALDAGTDLRRVRSGTEYRGEVVAPHDVRDALDVADELISELSPVIDSLLS